MLVICLIFGGSQQLAGAEQAMAASLTSEATTEVSTAVEETELRVNATEKVETNTLTVNVNKGSYKGSFKVYAINEDGGEEYYLPGSWSFWKQEYYAKLPYGNYHFEIRGISGYHAEFTPVTAEVNATSSPVVQAVLVEGEKAQTGSLLVELIDNKNISVDGVEYEVKNADNEIITEFGSLKFGQYTVEIKNYNTEKYELSESDKKQTVVISEDNPRVKASFVFTKKLILDGTSKVSINFWRLIPDKNDLSALIFSKRYTVYTIHPVSGKKIYGKYKESTDLPIPKFLLGKYKGIVESLGIKVSLNDIYEIELPSTEDGIDYKIQASCDNRGLATADSYCDLTVQSGKYYKIGFQVADKAAPVKITSTFSDGKKRNVDYVAIKKRDPLFSATVNFFLGKFVFSGTNGAEIKNMSKLTDGISYKIVPVSIPEGFDANPAEYTVIGQKKAKTNDAIKFEYTRKNKAALRVRFKTGLFRKPQGENPYTIKVSDKDKQLSVKIAKIGKNTCEIVVPAAKEEKTYKIEAWCKDEAYVLKHTFKSIAVKEDETKEVDFDVQKAEPLKIESEFLGGESREIKYVASFGDEANGARVEGVSPLRLYPGQRYTVRPVSVPEGFTIDTESKETVHKTLSTVFNPMNFKYTKQDTTKIVAEIKGLTKYKPEVEIFAIGNDGAKYKGIRGADGNYEIYVKTEADGSKFRVEAQSLEKKLTLKYTYQVIEVKDNEEAKLVFDVVKADSLNIETIFSEGEGTKPEISYVAERTDNTEESGAVYTDINKVNKDGEYRVYPKPVPKGYRVLPAEQTTEKVKSGWWIFKKEAFKPMVFIFEKKILAKLKIEAKLKDSEEILTDVSFMVEDKDGHKIGENELNEGIELGKYKVTAVFDENKYELDGENSREVVLDKAEEEYRTSFIFEKAVKGSLTLKAVDEEEKDITGDISFTVKQGENVLESLKDMKLGKYEVTAAFVEKNYKLQEGQKNPVDVSLTKENKDAELIFKFEKVKQTPPVQEKGKLTVKISNYGNTAEFDKIDIYLVDENHKRIETPNWNTSVEDNWWLLDDYMVYTVELPVKADGSEYIVQADCNIDGKAFKSHNYEKIKLDTKGKELKFSLGDAKPLNIISTFPAKDVFELKYKAEAGTDDKGFFITDMNHLCSGNKYMISPLNLPFEYEATPASMETEYSYWSKKFNDMEFTIKLVIGG